MHICALRTTAIVFIAALAACGGSTTSKPSTQVAVKVNKDEISVHQLNAVLSRVPAGGLSIEQQQQAKKQVVDGLVDQQLLVEQAIEKKLDRDPEVLNAIESSRRQILAQAYVQKTLGAAAKPAEVDVKKYYESNPALFSQRKTYRLQEIITNMPPERLNELNEQIVKSKSLNDVAAWLRANNFQIAGNSAVRGAEQLPLATLPRVSAMKDGEIAAFQNDKQVTVLQVLASLSQPLNEKEAAPFIETFLTNQKRDELARAELKRLREAAKVEYVGELASLSKLPAAIAEPNVEMEKSGATKPSDKTVVDKGVSGLR